MTTCCWYSFESSIAIKAFRKFDQNIYLGGNAFKTSVRHGDEVTTSEKDMLSLKNISSSCKIPAANPKSLRAPLLIPCPLTLGVAVCGLKARLTNITFPFLLLVIMTAPTHLDPSELGTKSYWDNAYNTERQNFAAHSTDEGTIWFSDAGAEERMLSFLENLADEGILHKGEEEEEEEEGSDVAKQNPAELSKRTRFLDLGTGNGHLLFALREEEWLGEMVGVDYSSQSVMLASSIRDANYTSVANAIVFYEWDSLTQPAGPWLRDGFDVVLDKGTFDAMCLSQDTDAQGRRVYERYRGRVEPLIKQGGRLLITSCNWTEEELRQWFDQGQLAFEGKVKYPSFTFGGKTGSSVVTLCFKKR